MGRFPSEDESLEEIDTEPGEAIHAAQLRLRGSRPNPATSGAAIDFDLASAEPATIELLDLAGRRVWARDLVGLGPGPHTALLAEGVPLPSGVYFARLVQLGHSASRRIVWIH